MKEFSIFTITLNCCLSFHSHSLEYRVEFSQGYRACGSTIELMLKLYENPAAFY